MSVILLTLDIISICCLAAFLLHRYGDWRKQHVLVTLATFIAWYFSFMIIFVMPLDVSNTFYRQCLKDHTPAPAPTLPYTNDSSNGSSTVSTPLDLTFAANTSTGPIHSSTPADDACQKPWSYVPEHILPTLWHVVYWTSQALTWLIIPMMQAYAQAGDFTVIGKVKSALIENAIYYGTYLIIFIVCLIYLAVKPNIHIDGSQLKVLAITASNTWGLFLLVLLLGYGLVEVPRSCWNNSQRGHMLQGTYFKIAKLSTEKSEAEEFLEDVLDDVKKAADTIKYTHPFRKNVDTIVDKCPESLQRTVQRNKDDYEDFNNPTETPTEKSLVRLHKKVIKTMQTYRRTQCQWSMTMQKAFDLEDTANNEASSHRSFKRTYGPYDGLWRQCYSPTVEWYWKCIIVPWFLRIFTVILALFSIMVVWSECLFFVKSPVLSLFALFVQAARKNYDYLAIELVCFITIAFLSYCAYYTIFKIRVFNFYYLAAPHQTDANSLLFCGALLCRLTPPLCLNFLGLIHLDTHITKENHIVETYYTEIMGHMDVINFISDGFNIYFPIAIVLLCICTFFRLGTRLLHCLGFQQFVGDDDMTQELVDEGRELVRREHRKIQRLEEGEARRKNWNERFGDSNPAVVDGESNRRRAAPPRQQSAAKSPTENDRTELLKQVDPIDYTGQSGDPFEDVPVSGRPSVNRFDSDTGGRYQTKPTRPTNFGSALSSRTAPAQSRGPPRGIFDDV